MFVGTPQRLLSDGGIGWHIRTGDIILRDHHIPKADPFSATMRGRPWFAWEWLYDALVSKVHGWWGLNGVAFLGATLLALTFALLFRALLQRCGYLLPALMLWLLVLLASSVHWHARPHLFTWVLTIAWCLLLDGNREDRMQNWRWLPVLMLPWANLHGGFVLGLALTFVYWVGLVIEWGTGHATPEAKKQVLQLAAIGLLCGAVSLVNPSGYQLHVHIWRYLSDAGLIHKIQEFAAPNLSWAATRCFLVLLIVAAVAAAIKPRAVGIPRLLVFGLMAWLGLSTVRNLPLAAMVIVLAVAPAIKEILGEWPRRRAVLSKLKTLSQQAFTIESQNRVPVWPMAAVLVGIIICAQGGMLFGRRIVRAEFDSQKFPAHAVDYLKARKAQGAAMSAVLSTDAWGGYLIYRLWPDAAMIVDDRHDFYGAEFLAHYISVLHGESGWEHQLDAWKSDWVVAPVRSPLCALLKTSPHWRQSYADDVAVVFERR